MPEPVDPTNGPDRGQPPEPTGAVSDEAREPDVATAERDPESEADATEAPQPEAVDETQPVTKTDDPEAAEQAEVSEAADEAAGQAEAPTASDESAAPTDSAEAEPATEETEADSAEPAEAEPATPAAIAAAAPAPDGLRKLLGVVRGRPGRGQIMVAILLAVLAFGAVVQGRTVSGSGDYAGARRGDLIQLLDSLDAARDRAESQLRDLQATKQDLENEGTRTEVALREAREEASTLAILSGTVGASGPGVVIQIDDPKDQVGASDLLNAVEELRDAGAEAIEINDTARIVAQTYFADEADGVSIDGTLVSQPYIIDVIGHPHTLSQAVEFPGGVTSTVALLGGSVDVEEQDPVEVTSLAVRREPEYAQPAD
jgi:uncharacterized protein YlxW (UPF0749 family)